MAFEERERNCAVNWHPPPIEYNGAFTRVLKNAMCYDDCWAAQGASAKVVASAYINGQIRKGL